MAAKKKKAKGVANAAAKAAALKALQALDQDTEKKQEEAQKKKRNARNGAEARQAGQAAPVEVSEIQAPPEKVVEETAPKEEKEVEEKVPATAQIAEVKKEEAKAPAKENPRVQEKETVSTTSDPADLLSQTMKEVEEQQPPKEKKVSEFMELTSMAMNDGQGAFTPTHDFSVDVDPFATIADIHATSRSNGRGANGAGHGEKKNGAEMEEVDAEQKLQEYYEKKGIKEPGAEWAEHFDPQEEEEEEEEHPIIKRRRGTDDQVDFSFLEKGDVEGEVTVGIKEVAIRLGGRTVLQDASWTVKTGERLALVGANGCGKTTQLRVMLGQLTPDNGSVVRSPANAKIAILEQSFVDDLNLEHTLKEELLSALPEQKAVMDELVEVEAKLKENPEDVEEADRLVNRFTELTTQAEEYQVNRLEDTIDAICKVAGFEPDDLDRKVGLFSGGWKVRIGVCKIFMLRPDVLLLDEPTNHLDLQAVEWIEKYLTQQDLPMVIVTHDREFMNRVCNRVVETVEGMTYSYKGNYTDFVRQKEMKMENWKKKYDLQEKRRKELEEYIKVNKSNQSLAQARKQRAKELEDINENGIDPPPAFVKRINFRFPEPPKDRRGGAQTEILAELRRVTHGYGTKDDEEFELLQDVDFMVTPGDKIGIVGGNGKGKSTMLRLLMGEESARDSGTIRPADPKMTGFFAQHQADLLPMDKTGWEVVKEANEILMADEKLKEIMKKFRFRGDRMHVKISNLSGGEKARLAIVRMMLIPSRMLIFDEPTNHLDVPMKETLEFALREYEGAVVVVSHDRWFLSQTCKKIVEVVDGKVKHYDGDFRFYMDSNADVRRKVEEHYTGIDGLIESVPASLEERRKKERKGLRKHRRARVVEERQQVLNSSFLSSREWRR